MMKLIIVSLIVVIAVWTQLAQADEFGKSGKSCRNCVNSGGGHKSTNLSSGKSCRSCRKSDTYSHKSKYLRYCGNTFFGYQDAKGYYYGDEKSCLDFVIAPGVPAVLNIGCYNDANFNNLPLLHKQLPAVCAYSSAEPDKSCTRPGYTKIADFDWQDIYFNRHPKEDITGVHSIISGNGDSSILCLRKPFVCYKGTRFIDLRFISGYGLYCASYTAQGVCPNGAVLASSPSFVALNGTDQSAVLSSALRYATGGRDLINLCVQPFNPEGQGDL